MVLHKRFIKQHSLFNFQKYFDNVPHQKFLKKINFHGKHRKVFFGINKPVKRQETKITNTRSVFTLVSCHKYRQLSPVLLHIHKLDENILWKKFADHNKLFKTVKTVAPCRRLQNYLFT